MSSHVDERFYRAKDEIPIKLTDSDPPPFGERSVGAKDHETADSGDDGPTRCAEIDLVRSGLSEYKRMVNED